MSFLDNYEDLVAFLEHPQNRANLAEAMRYDFRTFVIVENLLIRRQNIIEYSFLIESIELFQQLADGRLQTNLALFWPPGWGKTAILIYFCAWCLIRNPEVQFLYTNCVYNSVKQRGGEVLNIIKSNYTKLLFDVSVDKASTSRTLFRINKASARSGFIGVAFEGGITGLDAGNPNSPEPEFTWQDKETEEAGNSDEVLPFGGGLCLPYNEVIYTEIGILKIGDIVENRLQLKVYALDEIQQKIVLTKITAFHKNSPKDIHRIIFNNGSYIDCTGDHKIYTENRGYVEALRLQTDDIIPSYFVDIAPFAVKPFAKFFDRMRTIRNYLYLFWCKCSFDCVVVGVGVITPFSNSSTPFVKNCPRFSSNKTSIGDRKEALRGNNRSPLYHILIKKNQPTYCISTWRYNFISSKSQATILHNCIDDPLSASHFRSETRKETCRNVYTGTLMSRIRGKNCKKIAVFQRLAIDDLGDILKEHDKTGLDRWTFHEVQAYVNSKSTCERVKSSEYLESMAKMDSMKQEFMAQYQQSPVVPSGEIIKPEWFRYHNNEMWEWHMIDMFITADTASGKNDSGDYTVFAVWAMTTMGLCLVDLIRGKWDFPELRKQAIILWEKWRCKRTEKGEVGWTKYGNGDRLSCLYVEDSNSGTGLIQELQDMHNKSGYHLIVSQLTTAGKDKVFRTQEVTPYIEAGYVWLPDNRSDITTDLVLECRNFTYDNTHKNDDQIDCLVYAIQKGIMGRKSLFRLPMENFNF